MKINGSEIYALYTYRSNHPWVEYKNIVWLLNNWLQLFLWFNITSFSNRGESTTKVTCTTTNILNASLFKFNWDIKIVIIATEITNVIRPTKHLFSSLLISEAKTSSR